ncbi:MAG: hypothetical protein IJQ58_00395 [Synergistaceae bacterium]|nr:hypothetical protein [Synergistaceae bacterium]
MTPETEKESSFLSLTEEEYEAEFKSLKGIAGRRLDVDEVRRERLKKYESIA